MIDEKEVLKILKRYEGRMNPTAYFSLEADIVNIEALEQEPTTKNNLGVDWEELKGKIFMEVDGGTDDNWLRYGEVCDRISNSIDDFKANLPSVTPQEPRKGHWIETGDYFTGAYEDLRFYECSCCHEDSLEEGDYCPNCGADMREVIEDGND